MNALNHLRPATSPRLFPSHRALHEFIKGRPDLREMLQLLTRTLDLADTADADTSTMCSKWSAQDSVNPYRCARIALRTVVLDAFGLDITGPDTYLESSGSLYDDLKEYLARHLVVESPVDPNITLTRQLGAAVVTDCGNHRESKPVKNLGWLSRHWSEIRDFILYPHPPVSHGMNPDVFLVARLKDGRRYSTGFASRTVLDGVLNRPTFKGLPVTDFTQPEA